MSELRIAAAAIVIHELGHVRKFTIFKPTKAAMKAVDDYRNKSGGRDWRKIVITDGVKGQRYDHVSDKTYKYVMSEYEERIDVLTLTVVTWQ
jgi:hypothetical protein